jgi:hypothetical protein
MIDAQPALRGQALEIVPEIKMRSPGCSPAARLSSLARQPLESGARLGRTYRRPSARALSVDSVGMTL